MSNSKQNQFINATESPYSGSDTTNTTLNNNNTKLSPPYISSNSQSQYSPQQRKDEVNINNYYSLKPNTIPSYVIERLSHYNIDINLNDPFVATFRDSKGNVDWSEFLKVLKSPNGIVSLNQLQKIQPQPLKKSRLEPNPSEMRSFSNSNSANLQSINEDYDHNGDIVHNVFGGYDLDSKWKGGHRLKELFGSPVVSNNEDDDDDESDLETESNSSSDYDAQNVDLEKGGHRKSKKARRFRLDRERDIKERAKQWIDDNKNNWKPKLFESIMSNSYFPLFFRLISLTLTVLALALSARLVHVTRQNSVRQQASPLMALIVQANAVLYLIYITYDEFTSQPLGLRNPRAKIRLILFDLIFIIFSSANLSLSFQSIYDSRWVCSQNISSDAILYDPTMCDMVKALTAFLLVTLTVWCINFSISVFRIVHTVSSRTKN